MIIGSANTSLHCGKARKAALNVATHRARANGKQGWSNGLDHVRYCKCASADSTAATGFSGKASGNAPDAMS